MARPNKQKVDYFPHYVKAGRTVYILEDRYGNDGYAFWFKLLELLCDSDGHFIDCKIPTNFEFLLAKTHVEAEKAEQIINTLVNIGKIDAELWGERVIWVQNLLDNLSSVYDRRKDNLPAKPQLLQAETKEKPSKCKQKPDETGVFNDENQQSIVKDSIEKDSIVKYPYQDIADKWNSICGAYLPKIAKLNERRKLKIKARLTEFGRQEAWLPTTEALFEKIIESDFLKGENNHNWVVTFDWVFENPTNWVKIMEGNYDNHRGAKKAALQPNINLGVGEYIDNTGRRTYGTGKATIPNDAPPRPSERHCWNVSTSQWIIL